MSNDKISQVLGIRPISEAKQEEEIIDDNPSVNNEIEETIDNPLVKHEPPQPPALNVDDDENIQDLEEARQNIKDLIHTGYDAMAEILEIAKQSEQPRAFEVVSTLMKTMLEANKDLADIASKKKYAKEELLGPKEAAQTNVTNNNLIVSTADLLKMIKGEGENG